MTTVPALTPDELANAMQDLPGWELEGDKIKKMYTLENYTAGLAFAVTVGTLAEAHGHHPDMMIGWRKVTVTFTTHDSGNKITQKDVDIARAIESLGYPKS